MDDFKKHLKILFYVLTKECTENRLNILIYCKENNINVEEELEYSHFLCVNHNLIKMGYRPFEVKEIISLRRDYSSTYIFSSRK